ncbi:LPS assembly protein LptD [Devosia sp. J2-20]|uniref:LPS-assembly protein LptD n=1 Tax=Devosia sp. J2-20 TaxID=3026161 RepID=UPI00249BC12D|nr:LPS assembly protein LptD [Devosia sp. J2-20]WDQ97997.1 LPS assembly protein LptD [Devosia sp. J2-20]
MTSALRLASASAVVALMAATSVPAQELIPTDFFNAPIDPSSPSAIEANTLTFDQASNVILASGDVVLKRGGYTLTGQNLTYHRGNNDVYFTGAVTIRDPSGNLTETNDLQITGGMKQAFLDAMTITTYDGARITADSADYDAALETLLVNATYAPCGECIDDKGRRIGWSMKAKRIISNADGSLYMDQPSLAILGIPVAWLPFFWMPDTSENALSRVPKPTYSYTEKTGHSLAFTSTVYSTRWSDVVLTPTLMSRQGLLMGAAWTQRFDGGSFTVKGSALYQLDQSAFTFSEAKRDWRGAAQFSGSFTPIDDWTVGLSYTAFTDAAYLPDYTRTDAKSSVNEIYATNLTRDTYINARVQHFNQLGNVTEASHGQQGQTLPTVRFEHVEDLAPGMGRIEISGRLLGIHRDLDSGTTTNGTPYVFGYAGTKQHVSLQAGWQNQYVGAGGFVFTPYLGGRADAAYYDGGNGTGPAATTLWSATPIAAMDVRFPMVAGDGQTVHLVEPIAQLVYRGSETTAVGITNDDAQSFVFDDTNLFSFNRFSGGDRQETGLRANIGGRYQVSFSDDAYLELIGGQSFHLAGANAFAATDPAQTATGAGLDTTASYAVLGAYGAFEPGIKIGGKLQIDTFAPRITRGGFGASFSQDGYTASADYNYLAANTAAGVISDQHEIGVGVGVPVADYWTIRAASYWDLQAGKWYNVSGGVQYDDGYLLMSLDGTKTNGTVDDTTITATFAIKAPAGLNFGYSRAFQAGQ